MTGLISNLIIVLLLVISFEEGVFLQTPKSSPRKRWLETDSVLYIPDTTNLGLNEEHVNLFQTLTQVSEIANMVMGLLDSIFVPSPDAIDLEEKLKSTHLLKCFSEVSASQVSEILKIFLVFWDKFLTGETNLKKENEFAYDKLLNQVTKIVELEHKNRQLTRENERLTSELFELFSKCQCTSPAKYSPEGFGNCHYGASKAGQRSWLWCYVEQKFGDPRHVCPDAIASVSSPGWYWSRMACLAE